MRELERSMLSSKQEKEDLSRDLCEVCFLITKKRGGGEVGIKMIVDSIFPVMIFRKSELFF